MNSSNSLSHAQLLELLLGLQEQPGAQPSDRELAEAASWQGSARDEWFHWGMFYPKGMTRQAQYALRSLQARAKELGLNTAWRQVFMEEYNPDEVYGTPFRIGNFAAQKGVNGALVLGPQSSSAIGAQEAEFRHISMKILGSFSVKSAWLPLEKIQSPAAYARILTTLV